MDLTAWIGVYSREILVVTLTGLESTVLGVIWGIVEASDAIVNMLAVASSIGAGRVADLEAEEVPTEESRMEG